MSNDTLEQLDPMSIRDNFRDDTGKLYLVRCPKCKAENYAPSVASGECAWCGWKEILQGEPND